MLEQVNRIVNLFEKTCLLGTFYLDQSYDRLMEASLSKKILQGLAACRWSGRNEIVETDTATYYLDGAQ